MCIRDLFYERIHYHSFQNEQIVGGHLVGVFSYDFTNYDIESHDYIPHTRQNSICQAQLRMKVKAE